MKHLFFALLLSVGLSADELSGPGRKTLVQEPWGTVFCAEGSAVKKDTFDRHFRVTTDKGQVALSRTVDGWLMQAPNQNLRVRRQTLLNGNEELLVTFNGERYRFEKKPAEYAWNFPTGRSYFTLREGEVRGGIGSAGSFKMLKHSGAASYNIQSDVGESEVLLGRKKRKGSGYQYVVVKQTGEDLAKHPLLVRGVLFDNGPVGVFVRLPGSPVLEALDWKQIETVSSTVPYPEAKTAEGTAPAGDPLQAVQPARDEDPLRLRRKPFEKDRSMFDPTLQAPPWNVNTWSQPPK